jgi:predicted dehydrogenase
MRTFVQPTEVEDTLAGWVRFAGGALATMECTTCAHGKHFAIDVLGENASMRIAGDPDGHTFDWQVRAPSGTARKAIIDKGFKLVPAPPDAQNSLARGFAKLAARIRGKPWRPPGHWAHTPFIRAFLEAIHGGTPGPVPVSEARRSLELCAALYESALLRRVVSLPLDSSSPVYNGVKTEKMELQSRSQPVGAGIAVSG